MLRHLVVDLVALALIAFAVFSGAPWAAWAVTGYAGLMLLLKIAAILSKMPTPRASDAPPEGIYHLLYGTGLALLLVGGLHGQAVLWAMLWVLDWYGARKR